MSQCLSVSVTFSGTSCAKIIGGPHDLDPRGFGGRPPPQAVNIMTIGILDDWNVACILYRVCVILIRAIPMNVDNS